MTMKMIDNETIKMFHRAVPRILDRSVDAGRAAGGRARDYESSRRDVVVARDALAEAESQLARHAPYRGRSAEADSAIAEAEAAVIAAQAKLSTAELFAESDRQNCLSYSGVVARWEQHACAAQRCSVLARLVHPIDAEFQYEFRDLVGAAGLYGTLIDG